MKAVIIYFSKTGFTENYAKWISEELNCKYVNYKNRNSINLNEYDVVIYGGGLHAGKINGIKWFKEKLPQLKDKKNIVYVVGAMPTEADDVEKTINGNFTEEEFKYIKTFYCMGGLNYEKMGVVDKIMMAGLKSALKSGKMKDVDSEELLKYVSNSFDASDKKYIEPIVDYVKSSYKN